MGKTSAAEFNIFKRFSFSPLLTSDPVSSLNA